MNDGLCEKALQKTVKEFLLSASRHRGIYFFSCPSALSRTPATSSSTRSHA